MLCPECGNNVLKSKLVKLNIKVHGGVDVVYDAICPFCSNELGRMVWGRFVSRGGTRPEPWVELGLGRKGEDEGRRSERSGEKESRGVIYLCPHCGEALPQNLEELPTIPAEGDRRKGERRQQSDRRQHDTPGYFPERRKGDRRKSADRRVTRYTYSDKKDTRESAEKPPSSPKRQSAPAPEAAVDQRKGDRRKENKPVLYERRKANRDRRKKDSGIDMSI